MCLGFLDKKKKKEGKISLQTAIITSKSRRMSLISKVLSVISIITILHAGFSSYEFNQLAKSVPVKPKVLEAIPLDIQCEAIIGLLLFILSSFLAFDKLQVTPLRNCGADGKASNVIKLNQYLKYISLNEASNVDNMMGRDLTGHVSYTPSMVGIHAKRKAVQDWIKSDKN